MPGKHWMCRNGSVPGEGLWRGCFVASWRLVGFMMGDGLG